MRGEAASSVMMVAMVSFMVEFSVDIVKLKKTSFKWKVVV
jgi:hypothetical protein